MTQDQYERSGSKTARRMTARADKRREAGTNLWSIKFCEEEWSWGRGF